MNRFVHTAIVALIVPSVYTARADAYLGVSVFGAALMVEKPSALEPVFRPQIDQFWRRVIEQLRCTMNVLCEIDFSGSISSFREEIVRVSLSDTRLERTSTYTDLILDCERIRCSVLNGGIYYLNFVTSSGTEIAVQDIQKDSDPMDARKTAEHLIDRMLNTIEWTHR